MLSVMRRILVAFVLMPIFSTWAMSESSCHETSKTIKPDWVKNLDYSISDYYVGVGSADEHVSKNKDDQVKSAENNAKLHLVQSIEVSIRAENAQSTYVNSQGVQQDAYSKRTEIAEEVLRGLKIKDQWIDPETCAYYTLMVISKIEVDQSKHEKAMKNRLDKIKLLLVDGTNYEKNRNIKMRRKYLEEARSLLGETDFSGMPEELNKETYLRKILDALNQIKSEAQKVKGRMAIFAINQDGKLRLDVLQKMLEQLRASDVLMDRLVGECNSPDTCINLASERGFNKLALLNATSRIETSQMGALKGTLTISRTIYDIDSHKEIKVADTVSAQVIGWKSDELDWQSAAVKAMQGFK